MIGSVPAIGMLYDTLIFLLAIHGFQVIQSTAPLLPAVGVLQGLERILWADDLSLQLSYYVSLLVGLTSQLFNSH